MKYFGNIQKYISLAVILLYFIAGCYLLISPRFQMMQKEFRIILAICLILYGGYRLARIFMIKKIDTREEEEV